MGWDGMGGVQGAPPYVQSNQQYVGDTILFFLVPSPPNAAKLLSVSLTHGTLGYLLFGYMA